MLHRASPVFEVKVERQQGRDESHASPNALDSHEPREDPHESRGDEPPTTRRLHYARVLLPGGGASLRGGLAFTTGSQHGFTYRDLVSWFDEHLVAPRCMKRPEVFHEPGAPPLTGASNVGALAITRSARTRVLAALTNFVGPLADDGFLTAAIHAARVCRAIFPNRTRWVPSPREADALSDIVLSLFAADILLDPDFYRTHLCVCQRCSGLSIEPRENAVRRVCTPCDGGLASFSGR